MILPTNQFLIGLETAAATLPPPAPVLEIVVTFVRGKTGRVWMVETVLCANPYGQNVDKMKAYEEAARKMNELIFSKIYLVTSRPGVRSAKCRWTAGHAH
eukprot:SAG31_NODE_8762_length_1392_cov_2.344934_3_plen_100_part_00